MSAAEYTAGVALLVLVVGSNAYAAVALRASFASGMRGPYARLVEAVAATALLVGALTLLGIVGLFAFAPVVVAVPAAALALGWVLKRRAAPGPSQDRWSTSSTPPYARVIAVAVVATVAAQWLTRVVGIFDYGMRNYDSLSYHMPLAARMSQSGWLLDLHHVWQDPLPGFYPANSELIHALGLLLFGGHDFLSIFINLGWLALALLAGWCVGGRHGVGPATLLGVALIAATVQFSSSQPGEAKNDIAGLALVVSALALALNADRRPPLLILAGAALGLAGGMRYALLGPVLPLLGLLLVLAWPLGKAVRGAVVATAVAAGGVWYLRNMIHSGNPLAPSELAIGPLALPGPHSPFADEIAPSVARYLLDRDVWDLQFRPVLRANLGPLWFVTLAGAAAGAIGATLSRPRLLRGAGVAALAAGALYIVTPASAGPEGVLFQFSIRYGFPALALGLVLLPLLPWLQQGRRPGAVLGVYAVIFVTTVTAAGGWPEAHREAGAALVVTVGAIILAAKAVRRRAPRPAAAAAVGAVAAIALLAGGWQASKIYERNRYAEAGPVQGAEFAGIWSWTRAIEDARLGFAGPQMNYPLFGRDTSNYVRPIARSTSRGGLERFINCEAFRREINRQRFDFVVFAPLPGTAAKAPEREFITTAASASPVYADSGGKYEVYAIEGNLSSLGC